MLPERTELLFTLGPPIPVPLGRAGRDPKAAIDQVRGDQQGDHRHGDHQPEQLGPDRVGRPRHVGDHERQLADVGEPETRHQRHTAGIAEGPDRAARDRRLAGHDRQDQADDHRQVPDDPDRVGEHTDRDEEEGDEPGSERPDVGPDLSRERRARERDARQEGAQHRRELARVRHPGRRQAEGEGEDREQLPAPGRRRRPEQAGDHPAGDDRDPDDQDDRPQTGADELRAHRPLVRAEEHRDQHQQRDHGQVLHQQDPHQHTTTRAVDRRPVGQDAEHHGRAAEGHDHPDDRPLGRIARQPDAEAAGDQPGDQDLGAAAQDRGPAHPPEPPPRELQPDREQEKRDPDLRQEADLADAADQPQRSGAHQHPGQQVADDRALPQPGQHQPEAQGRGQGQDHVEEQIEEGHRLNDQCPLSNVQCPSAGYPQDPGLPQPGSWTLGVGH